MLSSGVNLVCTYKSAVDLARRITSRESDGTIDSLLIT